MSVKWHLSILLCLRPDDLLINGEPLRVESVDNVMQTTRSYEVKTWMINNMGGLKSGQTTQTLYNT